MAHIRYGLIFQDYTAVHAKNTIYEFDPMTNIVQKLHEMSEEALAKHCSNQYLVLVSKYRNDNQLLINYLHDIKMETKAWIISTTF